MELERYRGDGLTFKVAIENRPTAFHIQSISSDYTHIIVYASRLSRSHTDIVEEARNNGDGFSIYEHRNVFDKMNNRISIVGETKHYRVIPAIRKDSNTLLADTRNEFSAKIGEHIEVQVTQAEERLRKPVKAKRVTVSLSLRAGREIPVESLYYTLDGSVKYPIRLTDEKRFSVFVPPEASLVVRAFENSNVTVYNLR